MSLISDALKKAQAQQQHSSGHTKDATSPRPAVPRSAPPPLPGPATAPAHPALEPAPRGRARRTGLLVVALMAALAICLGGGAALIVWGFLGTQSPPLDAPATTRAEVATVATPPPAARPAAPAVDDPSEGTEAPAPLPAIVFDLKTATPAPANAPASASEPVEAVAVSAPVSVARPVAVAAPPPAPAPAPPPPPPPAPIVVPQNQAALDYLVNIDVRGVMRGGSKILLYDASIQRSSAYSPGDTISDALGLHIVSISQSHLVLKDDAGATYTKRF